MSLKIKRKQRVFPENTSYYLTGSSVLSRCGVMKPSTKATEFKKRILNELETHIKADFFKKFFFTSLLKILDFQSHQIPAKHCSEAGQSHRENDKVVLCSAAVLQRSSSQVFQFSSSFPSICYRPRAGTGNAPARFLVEFISELKTHY